MTALPLLRQLNALIAVSAMCLFVVFVLSPAN